MLFLHRAQIRKANPAIILGGSGRNGQTPNRLLVAVHLRISIVVILPTLNFDYHILIIGIINQTHIRT